MSIFGGVVKEILLEEVTFYLRTGGANQVKSKEKDTREWEQRTQRTLDANALSWYPGDKTREEVGKIIRIMANDMHFILSKTEKH